jgi:transmembrane sensor
MNDKEAKLREREVEEAQRIAYLIAGHVRQDLTPEKQKELDKWLDADDNNMDLFEDLTDPSNLKKGMEYFARLDITNAKEKIYEHIQIKRLLKTPSFVYWSAAATLIAILGVVVFFYTFRHKTVQAPEQRATQGTHTDLPPGSPRATLVIGGATSIDLTNSKGNISGQQEAAIMNDGKLLAYARSNEASALDHRLIVPTGGEYRVTLSDGTNVWLNAATSMEYPASFGNKERVVKLNGEAYFEVARDARRPFRIQTNKGTVEVVGTKFNLSAYEKDDAERCSLFEGAVRVTAGKETQMLEPSSESTVLDGSKIVVKRNADIDEAIAWKNGMFSFTSDDIKTVMSQLSRWYGVEVEYRKKVGKLFTGKIYRDSNASQVLKMLELAGDVKFTIEGKKIIVQ